MSSRRTHGSLSIAQQFLASLEKCTTLRHLHQLQAFLTTRDLAQTQFFAFKLVRFCVLSLSDLPYASLIFHALRRPNVFLYTALLTAYSSSLRDPHPALHLFRVMVLRGQPAPNEFIYPHALKSCFDPSDLRLMRSIHTHVIKTGFEAYGVVKTSLVDAYSRYSDLGAARELFDELRDRNVVSWTAMVSGYCRAAMVGNAIAVFEEMTERDIASWNAVISGCTQNGFFTEAVHFFKRMFLSGSQPNETSLSCVLSACGHLSNLKLGKWVHGYSCKNDIDRSSYVSNSLLDMYGKCGSMREARLVFEKFSDRSLTAWNSIINCSALHGHCETAISFFREMELAGVRPDGITFVGLLNSCNHGGMVDQGLHYFDLMSKHYRIEPMIEHYGCVIDLLGRSGRFGEAEGLIRDMQVEPDEVVWGSLLNGCRIHGDSKLAEIAARRLMEMQPANSDYGVMLANLYSEYGQWEEVRNVRKVLKDVGGKKLPGCSWIEVDNVVHQFYSADPSWTRGNPGAEEIHQVLQDLLASVEV